MLLRLDPHLAMQYDDNGYTPLHLVAMKGTVKILDEFLQIVPSSFQSLTKEGETVFHLTVRYKRYDAFMYLARVFSDTSILHRQDQFGNTVLHLAVSACLSSCADYIINKTTADINSRNERGYTALDILEQSRSTPEIQGVKEMLKKAGGIKRIELSSLAEEGDITSPLGSPKDVLDIEFETPPQPENQLTNGYESPDKNGLINNHPFEHLSTSEEEPNAGANSSQHQVVEVAESENTNPPTSLQQHKLQSQRHMKELNEIYKARQNKQYEIYMEALQNARNTIILVAILIATVTFTTGISPPGGVYQDGPLKGQSTVGRTTAFKVFTICNNIALFTSLCLVIVLVSIIPFRRKPLVRLLTVAHKVMWVAVSFMATAYVAALWVILPHGKKENWTFAVLLSFSAGTMGAVFLYLGVVLARHWSTKLKWRKEKYNKKEGNAADKDLTISESINSDVDSAVLRGLGYHVY